MSWLFSRALVEAYSAANSSGGEQSAPLRSTPIAQAFLCKDKTTESWTRFPFGMTCAPLTESNGEELLRWFRAGFPVKTLAAQEKALASTESEAGYGKNLPVSLAKFDRDTSSWKTHQYSLFGGLDEFSATWPRWGMMRNGECWEQSTSEPTISESECGLLPTPTATDWKRTPMKMSYATRPERLGVPDDLAKRAVRQSGIAHARLVPDLWEWLMGWPLMWTDLKPLATDKFQQWLRSHGGH